MPVPALNPRVAGYVRDAAQALLRGDVVAAESAALLALALAPQHPAALVAHARAMQARRNFEAATDSYRAAIAAGAEEPIRQELAGTLFDSGRRDEAIAALQTPPPTSADGWTALGALLDRNGNAHGALAAAEHALALSADHGTAQLLAARSHTALGDIAAAAALYRRLTRVRVYAARAWFALLDLKTVRLDDDELQRVQRLQNESGLSEEDRILAAAALGQAMEQAGRAKEAFRAFEAANRRQRARAPWHAQAVSARMAAIRRAFAEPAGAATGQGGEVIFILGLMRSGTTLAEQVLSAHPDVIGASELNDLPSVLAAESRRRNRPFPDWVAQATPADWLRLGAEYLERTRRFQTRARFTDKFPENWPYIGAIARMLPGAKIVFCERDPVETLWSCYKQQFARGHCEWTYDFDSLARYAHDCALTLQQYEVLEAARCRRLSYEALVEDLDAQTRALLQFVGLDFHPACLDYANQQRESRTASAAQVRRPLQKASVRSDLYGELLDPLRAALARTDAGTAPA